MQVMPHCWQTQLVLQLCQRSSTRQRLATLAHILQACLGSPSHLQSLDKTSTSGENLLAINSRLHRGCLLLWNLALVVMHRQGFQR